MKHFVLQLTLILFFIWILPLGVFINPSQEKQACGGQRAVCLCTHKAQSPSKAQALMLTQQSSSAEKESVSAGGAGHFFLTYLKPAKVLLDQMQPNVEHEYLYSLLLIKSIEHIPLA